MGQLEKYGLYVLCLVIFLILGVTIWGGGDLPPQGRLAVSVPNSELNAGGPGGGPRAATQSPGTPSVEDLLHGKGTEPRKTEPKVDHPAAGDGGKTPVEPPKAPPAPETRTTYRVLAGDNFENIARKLGSPALRPVLQQLNPKVEPTRLQVGQELQMPTKAEIDRALGKGTPANADAATKDASAKDATAKDPAKDKPAAKDAVRTAPVAAAAAPASYTVAKGDTFESIAIRQLGSRKRVDDLREANPTLDPTRLKVGQKILLPKK